MTAEDALAAVVSEGMAVYHPATDPNEHVPEWAPPEEGGHYLGISSLVKKTATEYAKRIIDRKWEDDEEQRYWGFIGNALCDAQLKPITPYREVQVWSPMCDHAEAWHPDDPTQPCICPVCGMWPMVGHLDGITLRLDHLVMNEGKAFATIEEAGEQDHAFRQAIQYMGMAVNMRMNGARVFRIADFARNDPTIDHFIWPDGAVVAGVTLHIHPRFRPPATVIPRRIDVDEMNTILDRNRRKAQAIWASVQAGTLDAAQAWDRSPEGMFEFLYRMDETPVLATTEHEALTHAFAKLEADDAIKAHDREKAKAQAAVLAYMRELNITELKLEDGTRLLAVGGFEGARNPWLKVTRPKEVVA